MAFTTDTTTAIGQVRHLIGDLDSTAAEYDDTGIDFFLDQSAEDIFRAAALACLALASKYARKADKAVGDLRINLSHASRLYAEMAKRWDGRAAVLCEPVAGGISIADKDAEDERADRVRPEFFKGQFDNPAGPDPLKSDWND